MKLTVCIGSSCHVKGSREIIEMLQNLIVENDLKNNVELSSAFCMKNCGNGVNITIDDELFSVTPENINTFFQTEVLKRFRG